MKTFKIMVSFLLMGGVVFIGRFAFAANPYPNCHNGVNNGNFGPVNVCYSKVKLMPPYEKLQAKYPGMYIWEAETRLQKEESWKDKLPGATSTSYDQYNELRIVNLKTGDSSSEALTSNSPATPTTDAAVTKKNQSNLSNAVSLESGDMGNTSLGNGQVIAKKTCPIDTLGPEVCDILHNQVDFNSETKVKMDDEINADGSTTAVNVYHYNVLSGHSAAQIADAINALFPTMVERGGIKPSDPMSTLPQGGQASTYAQKSSNSKSIAFPEPKGHAASLPLDPFVSQDGFSFAQDIDGYSYVEPYKIVEANNSFDPDVVNPAALEIVASIDSGMDFDHPDVMNRIAITQSELPTAIRVAADSNGDEYVTIPELLSYFAVSKPSQLFSPAIKAQWADGIDGDNNGYKDDVLGWDFVDHDNYPFDEVTTTGNQSHGTGMTGIIAAQANNGQGLAGLASSNTLIKPLRVIRPDGDVRNIDVLLALKSIGRSDENATKISTIYIGASLFQDPGLLYMIENLKADNEKAVVLTPVGDDGIVMDRGISSTHNVIGVGATDIFNQVAPYSNKGPVVLLVAPGEHQLSSYTTNPAAPSSPFLQDPKYKYYVGTSTSGAIASSLPSIMRKRVHELEQILGVNTGWKGAHDKIWMMLGASALDSSLNNISSGNGLINFADSISAAEKFVQKMASSPSGIASVKETRAYSVACTISGSQVTVSFSQQALVNPNASILHGVDIYNPLYEYLFGDAWAPLFLDSLNVQTPWRMFITDGTTDPLTFTAIPLPQKARFHINQDNYSFEELQPTNQTLEVDCK
jgi:hypothetical protein